MKASVCAWASALVVAMCVVTAAHHSPAAFDRSKEVTLVGTVKDFRWQNPHTWLEVDVPDGKGATHTWGVEMTSPLFLIRAGWKNNSVKPGEGDGTGEPRPRSEDQGRNLHFDYAGGR